MPQSKLTPEDLYQIYLETSPKIDTFAESLWNDHFNNSQSDLYLGQSYQEGLKRASLDLGSIGFYFDPVKGSEPLIQKYLEERGGKFITWLSNSGKKEFANLLVDAYTSTGSYEEFRKMFREKYPFWKNYKSLQCWVTENGNATNSASLHIYDQYKIGYFTTILGNNPCPICLTENMYVHRLGENEPLYHVHSFVYDVNSETKDYILLKDKGWTLVYDVEVGDTAFSLNPETKEIEESIVTVSYVKPYEGNLIHLYNHNFDVLATEDHKIIYQSDWDSKHNKNKAYQFKDIKDFGKSNRIPRTGIWKGKKIEKVDIGSLEIDIVTFCKFMGYFLAEGCLVRDHQICIAQHNEKKRKIMVKDLKNLPLNVCEIKNGINIYSKELNTYCKQFGKSHEKFVPCIIKDLTPDLINIFLDAYLLGDGTIQKGKTTIVRGLPLKAKDNKKWFTSSEKMMNDISELILKTGNRPSINIQSPKGTVTTFKNGTYTSNYDVYYIAERTSKYATGQKMKKEVISFEGFVCGVTLEKNHTIYVKRNGKCCWLSNCQCTVKPELKGDDRKVDYSKYMTSKEKDRFYSNYEKFNPRAKAEPVKYTEADMRRAIDEVLAKKKEH